MRDYRKLRRQRRNDSIFVGIVVVLGVILYCAAWLAMLAAAVWVVITVAKHLGVL